MTDTPDTEALARWERMKELAPEVWGKKWRTAFSKEFGRHKTQISIWARKGAPLWALRATEYAVEAQREKNLRQSIERLL